ncbi:MAG: hypothetical protein JO016_14200 [Actinobacteria bacterium]|nr:hypothetical protein [Actinomycetota bacterium]
MTYEDPENGLAASAAKAGLSRRGLMRRAGGIGIVGVTAGLLIDTTAASAATTGTTAASAPSAGHTAATASTPLVAHVHDAKTGEVDLFTGERHVRVHDPALARALAQAAATGR